jgi:hypothetical protein
MLKTWDVSRLSFLRNGGHTCRTDGSGPITALSEVIEPMTVLHAIRDPAVTPMRSDILIFPDQPLPRTPPIITCETHESLCCPEEASALLIRRQSPVAFPTDLASRSSAPCCSGPVNLNCLLTRSPFWPVPCAARHCTNRLISNYRPDKRNSRAVITWPSAGDQPTARSPPRPVARRRVTQ